MAVEGAEGFDFSSVISRAFEAIGSNFLLFLALSLVLAGIPTFAFEWAAGLLATDGRIANGEELEFFFSPVFWAPVVLGVVVGIVTNVILQASLTRATVMHLSGERPTFGPLLTVGLTMILPMIAIGLLSAIGIMIGYLLLIVPGIILSLAWLVVAPVYVQERIGLLEAFGRSMELTRGVRWKLLLLMILLGIGLSILSVPVAGIVNVIESMKVPLVGPILNGVLGAVSSMISVTVTASIYVELREAKEGVAPDELETIFA